MKENCLPNGLPHAFVPGVVFTKVTELDGYIEHVWKFLKSCGWKYIQRDPQNAKRLQQKSNCSETTFLSSFALQQLSVRVCY